MELGVNGAVSHDDRARAAAVSLGQCQQLEQRQ